VGENNMASSLPSLGASQEYAISIHCLNRQEARAVASRLKKLHPISNPIHVEVDQRTVHVGPNADVFEPIRTNHFQSPYGPDITKENKRIVLAELRAHTEPLQKAAHNPKLPEDLRKVLQETVTKRHSGDPDTGMPELDLPPQIAALKDMDTFQKL
jgi:pyruvate-formate lyase